AAQNLRNGQVPGVSCSGANRDRTGDLLLAKQALSHLSYGPVGFECREAHDRTSAAASTSGRGRKSLAGLARNAGAPARISRRPPRAFPLIPPPNAAGARRRRGRMAGGRSQARRVRSPCRAPPPPPEGRPGRVARTRAL